MYNNILQGPKGGELQYHRYPRFPSTEAELEALLGIQVSAAHGCQSSASPQVPLIGGNAFAEGSVQYNKRLTGLPEAGAKVTNAIGCWTANAGPDVAPEGVGGVGSFLVGAYFDFESTFPTFPLSYGALRNGNAYGIALLGAATGDCYRFTLSDGVNTKDVATTVVRPSDKKSRGMIGLYDVTTGNVYLCVSGVPNIITVAMGVWLGMGGPVYTNIGAVGSGWDGSDTCTRYGFWAIGDAQLTNYGLTLDTIMRRLGWQ